MQEGLDQFVEKGLQVDARLYAMAVGYTLGRSAEAAAAAAGGSACVFGMARDLCRRRKGAAGFALLASLAGVAAVAAVAVVGGARRCRA